MKRICFLLVALLCVPARARAEDVVVPKVAVVEARGLGVPVASTEAVTRQLYATVARLGYQTVPEETSVRLSQAIGPGGAAPIELLAVAVNSHAESALSATLGARDGRYVVTLTLAKSNRTGPFYASDVAEAAALEPTVDRMTRALLPKVIQAAVPSAPEATRGRFRLALQTEGAFGVASHFFYNHLAGVRLDREFSPEFALGGYLGYANLKGKDGRVSDVLPYLQVEYRLHWDGSVVSVPLRFGTGYLPKNGPFLRLAAGPRVAVNDSLSIGLDALAPTFWVVRNSTVVSMDVAAEVDFAW